MKRTLTLALSAVLGGGLIASAYGQDNFPDSPENHWAYEALLNLKKAGLLVGYPDGLFRGGRPASRYEMAVALNALYQHLKGLADGLGAKITALEEKIRNMPTGGGGDVSRAEFQALRDALNALKAQVDGMKASADDIAALRRMASTFERELASLGVDVEAMKKGLADLANRVSALEKHRFPVDIHGTVDLLGYMGYSTDDRFGITRDGRPTGVHKGSGLPTGVGHDFNLWHEGSVLLETTNTEGPKGRVRFVAGNMLDDEDFSGSGSFFGRSSFHQGAPLAGRAFGDGEDPQFWIQELEISTKTSMFGADVNVSAGRLGKDTGHYFIRRPDTTLDYKNPYWDNHQQLFDGANLGLNFGNVMVDIYGGRLNNINTISGDPTLLNPLVVGNVGHAFEPGGASGNTSSRPRGFTSVTGIMPDNLLGVNLNFPIMAKGKINLQYAMFDSDSTTTLSASPLVQINRMTMWGGEVNFPLAFLELSAGYSQTNLGYNQDAVIDEDNAAWWVKLAWNAGERWGIHGGYRSIDPQFFAPGDWGRLGFWWNPNDVKGFNVGAWFAASDKTRISANAEFMTGSDTPIGTSLGLSEDDKINSFKIRLEHRVNDGWSFMAGAELVNWDIETRGLFVGGEPTERWYNLGLRFNFNENAWWNIMWEMSDVDGEGVIGFNPFSALPGDFRATGGKITSQFSIKY